MKNTHYINTICTPNSASETAEGMKKTLYRIFLDYSTSMSRNKRVVYDATINILKFLANKNSNAIDVEFLSQIIFLGDEVKFFNTEPLDPGMLLEIFSEDNYVLEGSTQIHKWVDFFDTDYSSASGYLDKLREYGYKCFNLIFTDFIGTDDEALRNTSLQRLTTNAYYPAYSDTLCVFFGPENKKAEAALIAGHENKVIPITDDIVSFLTPAIITSSVIRIDSTHIKTESSAETVKETLNNLKEGKAGADYATLSADEVAKAMEELMKGLA